MVWDSAAARPVPATHVGIAALSGAFQVPLATGVTIVCVPALQLLRDLAASYPIERAAAITGVKADTIQSLAREFAVSKPVSVRIGYGVDRWYQSDYAARAVAIALRNAIEGAAHITSWIGDSTDPATNSKTFTFICEWLTAR